MPECKQITEKEIQIQKFNELIEGRPYRVRRKKIHKKNFAKEGTFFLVLDAKVGQRKIQTALQVVGGYSAENYFNACEKMFQNLLEYASK
jgi:hypothetical protein